MSEHPPIDSRRGNEIVGQAKELATVYTPQWTPREGKPGLALVYLFARLIEIVIDRLNRVPEKHFLAFLDAAGVTPLPPKAAKAPVRFFLSGGAKGDGFVPKGTQLATDIKDQPPVTFETEKDLVVIRSQLASLFAHNAGADAYSKKSAVIQANEQNKKKEFQPFSGDTRVPHHLYIAHDTMLVINAKTRIELTFTVNDPSSYANFFKDRLNWFCHAKDTKVLLTPRADSGPLKVVFDNVEKIERLKVKDTETPWIWAETVNPLTQQDAALTITAIQCKTQAADMPPDLLFFNAAALDGTREFYPFGERPKLYDTFFLACPEALSKTGSKITLSPAFTNGGTASITLHWEFWNGEQWETLGKTTEDGVPVGDNPHAFSDPTNAFTAASANLKIQFNCPAIKEAEVNGKKSLWVRVRIMSGNYGEEAKMELTKAGKDKQPEERRLNDWTYTPESYQPPVITSLPISYAYESPQSPTHLLAYNNFIFPEEAVGVPFKPFKAVEETLPALYPGLDSRPTAGKRISLYLSVIGSVITEEPVVAWEYWTGSIWKSLGVSDGTRNLTEAGIVEFTAPGDFQASSLFGEQRFWIRAKLEKGDPSAFRLDGVCPNTVWARHAITITDEILGSSTETPEASFTLSRSPVLEGQKIEVREPEKPVEEELDDLKEGEGDDALTPVDEGKGESGATWVRWHEVDHFRFSGRKSRHYMIDRSTGRVTFGDGVHGMVPPAGKDNIRARIYQTGGEERGNVPVNTITVLKRGIAFIDSVFNVDAAGGGSAMETADQLVIRGPQTLKHRERAVTWEDYEWLAKEASFQVARAKCLPAKDAARAGKATLIIVPESDVAKPLPAQGLIRQVYQHIRAAMIPTADLTIQPPKYVVVSVTAIVYPEEDEQADLVRGLVEQRLRDFFHPLKGGPEGKGWEFGRDVHISEVCKIIEDIPGVNHAEEVAICSAFYDDGAPAIAVPTAGDYTPLLNRVVVGDEYLVSSGDHWILIPGAGEEFPPSAAPFLGNIHTREIHYLSNLKTNCRIPDIRPENIRYFRCLSGALREGYDFCAWCFGRQYSLR